MPFNYSKDFSDDEFEDQVVKCNIRDCSGNENEVCVYEEIVTYLNPDDRMCKGYSFLFKNKTIIQFPDLEKLEHFIKKYNKVKYVVADEDSTRILYLQKDYLGKIRDAFIQIKKENESIFHFRPCIDGGIILINKNQSNLFEMEVT
jgi:hypothetical protein